MHSLSAGGWWPASVALGQARYGPYGPPFKDAKLQATFEAEAKSLAGQSALITESTARKLLSSVINSTLAAGDSKIPEIEARVRAAAKTAAGPAARIPVASLLLGSLTVLLGAGATWAVVSVVRDRS